MISLPPAPETIIYVTVCNCKTKCSAHRCKCRKNGLNCSGCVDAKTVKIVRKMRKFFVKVELEIMTNLASQLEITRVHLDTHIV